MARFGLDDIQAQAILDMQLKRLQGLERISCWPSTGSWKSALPYYASLLADRNKMQEVPARPSSSRFGINTATIGKPPLNRWRTRSTSRTLLRRRSASLPSATPGI